VSERAAHPALEKLFELPRDLLGHAPVAERPGESLPPRVDDLITAVPGGWEFNEEVTAHFDEHVRRSVPLYEEMQRMVVDLSEWFVRDGSTIHDLGSATGETILRLRVKHVLKRNVRMIGLDNSLAMVRAATAKCQGTNAEFVHGDITHLTGIVPSDFITSILTLQFVPLGRRRRVLELAHAGLNEGGGFVIVERVTAEHAALEEIWLQSYWDFKRLQGLSDEMILHKARSLRGVLTPLSFSEYSRLLHEVGFSQVDVFFKWFCFVGLVAVKRTTRADARL
jgi:tRNA (cmo5U34)-methyltransferase